MTGKHYALGIAALILLHGLILAAFASNTISLQTRHPHHVYWFHHGGDEYGYAAQAYAIRDGNYQPNKFPLGFPLLLLPVLLLLPNASHALLLQVVALVWSGLLFPLAIVLLASLTRQLTARRSTALLAGAIFVLLPLLFLGLFALLWNREMAEIIAIHSTWAQMLSDGPTALLNLIAALLYIRVREQGYRWQGVLLLGGLLGFLGMVRFTGLLIGVVIGGLFLLDRQWKMALLLGVAAAFAFAPQAAYNLRFFGSPLSTGYTTLDELPPEGLFSLRYLLDALGKVWERIGLLSVVLGGAGIAALGYSGWRLWQRQPRYSLLLLGWVLSYVAFYSVYYYSWTGALMRFMIPVYPAAALLAAVLLADVFPWGRDATEGAANQGR